MRFLASLGMTQERQTGSGADGAPYDPDPDGNPVVFNVERNADGSWLNANNGNADNHWNPDNSFVFLRNQLHCAPGFVPGAVCLIRIIQERAGNPHVLRSYMGLLQHGNAERLRAMVGNIRDNKNIYVPPRH